MFFYGILKEKEYKIAAFKRNDALIFEERCGKMKIQISDLVMCALFTALVAIGAFLKIPLPGIPFTLQTLFIMLAGLLLGKKRAAIACGVYVLLGLVGLPIFTQGGGIGYVLKPTFGYLLGFILGAWLIGAIAERGGDGVPSWKQMTVACGAGLFVIYLFGTVYYYLLATLYLNKAVAIWPMLVSCVLTTLPGDIFLMVFAVFLAKRLWIPMKKIICKKAA